MEILKIEITIPIEFEYDYYSDRFEDALCRLISDAHSLAGNYEQETAKMLAKALKEAKPVYVKPMCDVCENLEDGDTLYKGTSWDGGVGYDYIWEIHYCPKCGRRLKDERKHKVVKR